MVFEENLCIGSDQEQLRVLRRSKTRKRVLGYKTCGFSGKRKVMFEDWCIFGRRWATVTVKGIRKKVTVTIKKGDGSAVFLQQYHG
jgi:hypothetical protein